MKREQWNILCVDRSKRAGHGFGDLKFQPSVLRLEVRSKYQKKKMYTCVL